MEKKYRYFTNAFEDWTGNKWVWKNEDGTQNHPMDSGDERIIAFYMGFLMGSKGQMHLREKLGDLKYIESKIKLLKKEIGKLQINKHN